MKTIFVHGGLHKTGTTSIQGMARTNHDNLKSRGVYYPPPGANYGSAGGGLHTIPAMIEKACSGDAGSASGEGSLNALLEDFEESGLQKLFISSEGFSRFGDKELAFLSDALRKYDVRPTLVFRHPISYRISFYCSRGGIDKENAREHFMRLGRLKFGSLAERWKAHFPHSAFLKYESHCDITKPVFELITGGQCDDMERDQRRRRSLSMDLAMLNSELRAVFPVEGNHYRTRIYNHLFTIQSSDEYRALHPDSNQRLLPISQDDQKALLDSLRKEIEKLSAISAIDFSDYCTPLDGHLIVPEDINKLKEIFVLKLLPISKKGSASI